MKILKIIPCFLLLLTGCNNSKKQDEPVKPVNSGVTLRLTNYTKYLDIKHDAVDFDSQIVHMIFITARKNGTYINCVLTLNCGGAETEVALSKEGNANYSYWSQDNTFEVIDVKGTFRYI